MPTLTVTDSTTARTPPRATVADNQRWLDAFAARTDLRDAPTRLLEFREQAVARLSGVAFPTRRDEDWRYSDFTRALNADWRLNQVNTPEVSLEKLRASKLGGYFLVTIDGEFRPELSDDVPGLTVGTLEEYLETEPHAYWLDRTVAELHAESSNAFVAVNAAFAKHSLYLGAGRGTRIEQPVHIHHLATRSTERRMLAGQVFVMLPSGAELTVIETFGTLAEGEAVFRNHVVRAGLGSNAHLRYRSVQAERETDLFVGHTAAEQQGGSNFDHLQVDLGGQQVRHNLNVEHKAAGLETNLNGLFLAGGQQRYDNQTFIDHAFPHGESHELYKGIVTGGAVTSFNGKVMVRPDAQKTNAFQQNDNLVIGDKAEANAKPQLEIFADDVKCSHGATIGQLDTEPLFYLRARGLPEAQAIELLQRGFLLEVLEKIEEEALRAHVEELLQTKFKAVAS